MIDFIFSREKDGMKKNNESTSIIFIVFGILVASSPLVAGSLIGYYGQTEKGMQWYRDLNKPRYIPPSLIFAIVWPILYIMLGLSFFTFLIYILHSLSLSSYSGVTIISYGLFLFFSNLSFNLMFPLFQFRFASLGGALSSCWLTWFTAILILVFYARYSSVYTIMLIIPYILWLSFACLIITHTYLLNR